MKDDRTIRQLHENATGSPKENHTSYTLNGKASRNASVSINAMKFLARNEELRKKRNTKEANNNCNNDVTLDQNIKIIDDKNSLCEQQESENILNLDTKEKVEKDKNADENLLSKTKVKKAYQMALTLLDMYYFCNMNDQLHVFDEHDGYWRMMPESESNRAIRRMMPDNMCNAVNKSILYEIYEWLLVLAEKIDSFPKEKRFYINFKDCAVNWQTGEIKTERQLLYFTYALEVNYSEIVGKENGAFLRFVDDVFENDNKTKAEFYKFLGLCLSDIRNLKISIFLYGPSNSGKSVFLNLLRQLVGEKWCSSLSFTQMGNEFAITQLLGKRLNLSGEVSGASNKRLDIFKSLTGNDEVTTCFKGKDHFQFKNESLLVFACNSLPEVSALEEFDSFLSRIIIFPFFRVKPRDEWIDNLNELLMEDAGTVLEVAMKGLQELSKDNYCFNETKAMKKCKHEFIGLYNSFALYAEKYIREDQESKITSDEIRKQYKVFCRNEGLIVLADNIWSQFLKRNYRCKPCTITVADGFGTNRLRGYRGIRLEKKIELETEAEGFNWKEE